MLHLITSLIQCTLYAGKLSATLLFPASVYELSSKFSVILQSKYRTSIFKYLHSVLTRRNSLNWPVKIFDVLCMSVIFRKGYLSFQQYISRLSYILTNDVSTPFTSTRFWKNTNALFSVFMEYSVNEWIIIWIVKRKWMCTYLNNHHTENRSTQAEFLKE